MDFDTEGRFIACISRDAKNFLFNVDTGLVSEKLYRNSVSGKIRSNIWGLISALVWFNRCRWNPLHPLISTTYGGANIEFTDPEKDVVTHILKSEGIINQVILMV